MKKWLIILLSSMIIILTIAIFGSGAFLKNPMTEDDDVIQAISKLEIEAKNENWENADHQLERAINAWNKIKNRIQFSVERTFLDDVDNELATIKGAIRAKDLSMLIISVEKIKFLWTILGK